MATMQRITNSEAGKLMARVLEQFVERGMIPRYINHCRHKDDPEWTEINDKYFDVEETWNRNNGTPENVTVTIEIIEITSRKGYGSVRRIEKIRVPKMASDNVIQKRIDKVVEILNA